MDYFAQLFRAAHAGAYGMNTMPEPSRAQREAGDYAKGRIDWRGLTVVIENPRGSLRKWWADDGTSGENLQTAHYGFFEAIDGADGDELDCYVGPYPEGDAVYVVNQFVRGAFDEHKILIGMPDERTARAVYLSNFKPGWTGLQSLVACTAAQFIQWARNGDHTKPLTPDQLTNGNDMDKVLWDSAEAPQPRGASLAQVLYAVRAHDGADGLIFDPLTRADILEDSDGVLAMDALVTVYRKLEFQMGVLKKLLDRVGGGKLSVAALQITDPFKRNGTTNVAAIFELSDGQTVSIFFHNPDVTPAKILPGDELVSWKWMLNKKDITIVVAPERGRDLNVRSVAARVMQLASKNSARFTTANAKRADVMGAIATLKTEFETKTETLNGLMAEISDLEAKVAALPPKVEPVVDPVVDPAPVEPVVEPTVTPDPDPLPVLDPADLFDPTTAENYASLVGNLAKLEYYQDTLDSMFGGRVVAIRNALRELGWDGEKYQALSKNGATAVFNFERVGAGANVVGLSVTVNGETVTDDLSKTPLELAAAIDALAPAPAVVPDAKDAADAAALEAAGFKNSTASTNVWVRSIAGNEGVKLGLNIQIGTDIYRAVKSVTMPGITGASQELGRFDTVEAAIAATQAAADDFEATQQPEPPHKSELVMDALVAEFGWKRKSALTAEKDFGGADTGGEMNPEGKRILIAGFDDTARYIQLDSGWETVFDMDTRDGTPRDVALAFNTRAAVYADSLNPQPVEPEPVIEPVVEPVVEPVIEPTPEPTVEPVAPNAEEEAARLEAERIAALQAANDAAAVVVAAEDAARAAAEEAIAQQAAEAEAAAAALTAAEDLAFVASAAAGEVDFMDKAVTDRLAEIAKTAEAGTELAGLIGQAKTAAKNAFIAAFKAKVG